MFHLKYNTLVIDHYSFIFDRYSTQKFINCSSIWNFSLVLAAKYAFYRILLYKVIKIQTRILVTHNVNHLSKADRIVVLENGRISEMGTYQTLLQGGSAFIKFVEEFAVQNQNDEEECSSSSDGLGK